MKTIFASLFAVGVLSLAACNANDGPIEEVAEDMDYVVEPHVEDSSDAMDDAADAIGDAADDAADTVEDAADPSEEL
ncbi:MAG: hypothetical protein AAFX03_04070 [Pseudomonadota bacterium]